MDPMINDDADQDKDQTIDLIKQALMKVIDDMTQMEADRHLPDGHPMKNVPVQAEVKPQGMPDDEMSELPDDENSEDSGQLDALLGKADQANADGSLPDEQESDLPDSVMNAVRSKKKVLPQ